MSSGPGVSALQDSPLNLVSNSATTTPQTATQATLSSSSSTHSLPSAPVIASSVSGSSSSASKDSTTNSIEVDHAYHLLANGTSLTTKPRSKSKRANSTASESERNKFRSRLDMFSIASSQSSHSHSSDKNPLDLNTTTVIEEEFRTEGNFTIRAENEPAAVKNPRQYSASSIADDPLPFVNVNKPQDEDDDDGDELTIPEEQELDFLKQIMESKISPLSPQLNHFQSAYPLNLFTSTFPVKSVTLPQLQALLNWHYTHQLPSCATVFPWLHGLQGGIHKADFLNAVANYTTVKNSKNYEKLNEGNKIPLNYRGLMVVRSSILKEKDTQYHGGSGIIKGSVDVSEVLQSVELLSHREIVDIVGELLRELKLGDGLTEQKFDDLIKLVTEDCIKLEVLPILKRIELPKTLSLRNFQIQVAKIAQISDFIVYCFNEDHSKHSEESNCCCASAARLLYCAQLKHSTDNPEFVDRLFSTLVLDKPELSFFATPETSNLLSMPAIKMDDYYKNEGSICSEFDLHSFLNWDTNYLLKEKMEIAKMSSATHLGDNVWLGNSTDVEVLKSKGYHPEKLNDRVSNLPLYINPENSTCAITKEQIQKHGEDNVLINPARKDWKLLLNCCDGSNFPDLSTLKRLLANDTFQTEYILLNFPPSGSIGIGDCSDSDLISILNTCKLIYTKSTYSRPSLIYCSDGYTESSLLAICYLIYLTARPLSKCIIDLHTIHGRPFFLFPTDITLISRIEDVLIQNSPRNVNDFKPLELEVPPMETIYANLFSQKEQNWCTRINGSMPSRILSHLYLGSLNHANSIELLEKLGITRIVSVGEEINWVRALESKITVLGETISVHENFQLPLTGRTNENEARFPITKVMRITNIQDDGIDPLTSLLPTILDFVNDAYESNERVLVHCRVGVSRSATVCIAEVMKRLNLNLIRSYFYVRVRRLNIIIQPNLRFFYELVKWEESQRLLKLEFGNGHHNRNGSGNGTSGGRTPNSMKMDRKKNGAVVKCDESITSLQSTESLLTHTIDLENSSLVNQLRNTRIRNGGNISPILNSVCDESLDDDDDDEEEFYEANYHDEERDRSKEEDGKWLRDVDWHILCRQIDLLNRTYIRTE